jgi:hypothetical protein
MKINGITISGGTNGTSGTSGSQGDKGGLQYTFEGGFTFPSPGGFTYQYNDDYYAINISPTDNDGNSLANYFNSILGSVSAKVYITSNINGVAAVDVWNIDAINPFNSDFSLGGILIGNSTNLTMGDNYSINIVFAGSNGRSGTSGTSGTSGSNGLMRLLAFSGTTGTPTPGTNTVTTTYSVLIPANTLSSNNILQLVWRMYRVTGNVGQMSSRIYKNTTNSQVGATQIGSTLTMNGGSTQFLGYCERNFSYNGTNITTFVNTTFSEYTTGSVQSTSFNNAVDNYILFTMQAATSLEIANMDLMKVFIYG